MIRPITVICWVLALSSGLYLYRAKHEVELMDKHIDQIARQTEDLRLQSRQLLDDWIRLGEPEQLHKYSDEYLGLKTIAPTQFARVSDLPNRLPPPQPDPVPDPVPEVTGPSSDVIAHATDDPTGPDAVAGLHLGADPDGVTEADSGDLPVPPIPPLVVPVSTVSLPAVSPPLQARPVTPRVTPEQEALRARLPAPSRVAEEPRPIDTRPVDTRPVDTRPADTRAADARPAETRPTMLAEPRGVGAPEALSPPVGQVPWQQRTVTPPREQAQRSMAGMPPLQAQGTGNTGQNVVLTQPNGPAAVRPVENRMAETRPIEPRWQPRPPAAQPPAQMMTREGAPPQMARVAPSPVPRPVPQSPGVSLLGMSRGTVPLPLPAPTPVSATWAGPPGQNR